MRTTKATSTEVMPNLLDLPQIEEKHKVKQVKAYLDAMQNPNDLLHECAEEGKGVD